LIGQKVADLKPFSSASFAACELRPPVLHVKTSVLSLGIVGRYAASSLSEMLIAPGRVSFSNDAGARTTMIRTSAPAASCFLSSSAVFCLAPVAHFVSGSTGYLGCC